MREAAGPSLFTSALLVGTAPLGQLPCRRRPGAQARRFFDFQVRPDGMDPHGSAVDAQLNRIGVGQ